MSPFPHSLRMNRPSAERPGTHHLHGCSGLGPFSLPSWPQPQRWVWRGVGRTVVISCLPQEATVCSSARVLLPGLPSLHRWVEQPAGPLPGLRRLQRARGEGVWTSEAQSKGRQGAALGSRSTPPAPLVQPFSQPAESQGGRQAWGPPGGQDEPKAVIAPGGLSLPPLLNVVIRVSPVHRSHPT